MTQFADEKMPAYSRAQSLAHCFHRHIDSLNYLYQRKYDHWEMTEDEKLKFLYDKVYDELNRSRDWPIKVLQFSSAIYLSVIAAKYWGNDIIKKFTSEEKFVITISLTILAAWTMYLIVRYHKNYINYRRTIVRIQALWNIGEISLIDKPVFSEKWFKESKEHYLIDGLQGWSFYVFYLVIISVASIFVLWK